MKSSICIGLLCWLMINSGWAQTYQVVAQGEGPSLAQALEQAKQQAIDQVGGRSIECETVVRNFEVCKDTLQSSPGAIVQKSEIIRQERMSNGMLRVTIRAWVVCKEKKFRQSCTIQLIVPLLPASNKLSKMAHYCREQLADRLNDYLVYQGLKVTLCKVQAAACWQQLQSACTAKALNAQFQELINPTAEYIVCCQLGLKRRRAEQLSSQYDLIATLTLQAYPRNSGIMLLHLICTKQVQIPALLYNQEKTGHSYCQQLVQQLWHCQDNPEDHLGALLYRAISQNAKKP